MLSVFFGVVMFSVVWTFAFVVCLGLLFGGLCVGTLRFILIFGGLIAWGCIFE